MGAVSSMAGQPRLARLSRTIATRRLEWGDTQGRIRCARRRSLIRSEMEVGRPSEAPTRDRAVPLRRVWVWDQHDGRASGLPDVPEASVGANPEATLLGHAGEAVNPTMLSFDEAKDFGFILTEEGERISVHRSVLPSRSGSGRPLPPPRGAVDCDCAERQARCHRRVDGSGGSARAGAMAQLEHSLRVAVMCP